jgi:hypothetical protein
MLSSISPLGERARGNRWGVTAGAYLVGSVAGGLAIGAALGSLGMLLGPLPTSARLGLAAGVAIVGAGADLAHSWLRLPTVHRQVDERWLGQYRGWVYGMGFGAQLGTGVVTVVTSAATYVVWGLALLSGSALGGAAIGATFGFFRAVPIWTVRGVATPAPLRQRHLRLQQRAVVGYWAAITGQALAGAILLGGRLLSGRVLP